MDPHPLLLVCLGYWLVRIGLILVAKAILP